MNNQEKYHEWSTWHKDWVKRYGNAMKEAKGLRYSRGEKKIAIQQVRKTYMQELWEARQRILGH